LNSDIDGTDKMNYGAVDRISSPHVYDLLRDHVRDSHGTQMYLKLIWLITKAFEDDKNTPSEKLKMIWTATFFLRIWRSWIINLSGRTLAKNVVTRNVYIGVELNAHAMLLLLIKLEDKKNLFITEYFNSSQACESFFRRLRSMTTTESTIINYYYTGHHTQN
jgi:hypothetical protein